jgi:hypothetical protein
MNNISVTTCLKQHTTKPIQRVLHHNYLAHTGNLPMLGITMNNAITVL